MTAWTAAGHDTASIPLTRAEHLDGRRVLDIRQRSEYLDGHLPGAMHIELGDIAHRAAEVPDEPTVVMCGHGERAMGAASLLEASRPPRPGRARRRTPGLGPGHRRPLGDRRVSTTDRQPRLGLRANLAQFCLLVAVNALVGGMVGQEQTVLPLLAEQEFHLTGYTFLLTYVFAFGITKAATNYFAGTWSDRFGRKPVLLAGWLLAIPVPLLLIWAPSWGWVVAANVLLGINQGLTWSTTVIMKIDLVGPRQRGLAMGFNEAAGYGAVALTAVLAGYLAAHYGLRPAPFLLGLSYALIALGLTAVFVRETRGHAELEASHHDNTHPDTDTEQPTDLPAHQLHRTRRCPLPARPAWSTTSTSACPGACSQSCSPPPACPSTASASSSPSTRPCGAWANWPPAHCRTGGAASTSSPPACSPKPPRWR